MFELKKQWQETSKACGLKCPHLLPYSLCHQFLLFVVFMGLFCIIRTLGCNWRAGLLSRLVADACLNPSHKQTHTHAHTLWGQLHHMIQIRVQTLVSLGPSPSSRCWPPAAFLIPFLHEWMNLGQLQSNNAGYKLKFNLGFCSRRGEDSHSPDSASISHTGSDLL